MSDSDQTVKEPTEAVVSVGWTGHRLLYLEALLVEATKQHRPHVVIVDERALSAAEWPRIASVLDAHSLLTVDFDRVALKQALPASVERVIALEADSLMVNFLGILRERPHLSAVLQLMREPDAASIGKRHRSLASGGAKSALIVMLSNLFSDRCSIHVLRSPLFPPAAVTTTLMSKGLCTTIVDPVLGAEGSGLDAVGGIVDPPTDPPVALVTGQLNARKSLDSLLEAWPHPLLRGYRLLLRGQVSDGTDVHRLVSDARGQGADVQLDDGYLSDEDLSRAPIAASAVLCLHQFDVPSGIAALAIQAGCPVIAFADTRLGRAVASQGLGASITEVDGGELAAAIATCRALPRSSVREKSLILHKEATTEIFSQQLLDRGGAGAETGVKDNGASVALTNGTNASSTIGAAPAPAGRLSRVVRGRVPDSAIRSLKAYRLKSFETYGSSRFSRPGLNGLDSHMIEVLMPERGGTFVELGANDGLQQSNTYALEREFGWRGLLIEPVPELAAQCHRNRPLAQTLCAVVSSPAAAGSPLGMQYTDLTTSVGASYLWSSAITLSSAISSILDGPPDLISLDVEGHEISVLEGLDDHLFPRWLLVETDDEPAVTSLLQHRITNVTKLTHHDYLFELTPNQ